MSKLYNWYMSEIYWAYVLYPDIYQVYVRYMSIIPGGWCCGGGHGPIPPEPPAITSPGLVMTLIFLTSEPRHPLHLLTWLWTAPFEDSTYWARGPDPTRNRRGTV